MAKNIRYNKLDPGHNVYHSVWVGKTSNFTPFSKPIDKLQTGSETLDFYEDST